MTFNLPLALVYARVLAVIPIVLLLGAADERSATIAFAVFCLAALTDDWTDLFGYRAPASAPTRPRR